ncbi:1-acylglycerol-3-phosphate O-acyltransferase [[Clostridium] ultunense Esp]|nr:1-acylglycerol-3-phosphate O-acyltransferase [[Clostridium] ultunense Esp]
MWLYRIGKRLVPPLISFYHRVEVFGRERFNPRRNYVVVGNHVSIIDPIYIAAFYPGILHFMAKKELFVKPFLRWLLTRLGAFPVNREAADLGAIKKALRLLKEGESIGLFPEGTRAEKWDERAFKQGASYLAIKGATPVLPVIIFGSQKALPKGSKTLRPAKIRLLYGEPLFPMPEEGVDEFGMRIRKAMESLLSEGEARGWLE